MTDFDYSDRLNSLIDDAEADWMPIARVTGTAGRMLECDSTLEQDVAMMQKIIGDLIDHGALPGDLTDDQPTFKPWPGTKAELLEHFRTEMLELGRLPSIGEICWIHIPPGKTPIPRPWIEPRRLLDRFAKAGQDREHPTDVDGNGVRPVRSSPRP